MILQLLAVLGTAVLTLGLTGRYIRWAKAREVMDIPNERSSHEEPVPVGGGIPLLAVTAFAWPLLARPLSAMHAILLAAMLILAFVSWLDDRTPLPWWSRLVLQSVAVVIMLCFIPGETNILPGDMPLAIDRMIAGLGWLWFINLFNFMDGMNGLAAGETLAIVLGLMLLSLNLAFNSETLWLMIVLTGAVVGFLWWNWHPAKIFMGDVGSVPLGFALGWLLIELSMAGHFIAALILPLYFLADATITLVRRLIRGEKVWQAHKEHFYQRAHQGGHSHAAVVSRIMAANAVLIALAFLSMTHPLIGMSLAILTVACLLFILRSMAAKP